MTQRLLGPRRSRRRTRLLLLTVLVGAAFTVFFVAASVGTLSGGSTFESGDGNLAVNGAGMHDWNSPVETITCPNTTPGSGINCGLDLVKGDANAQSDDSLGQGSKNDDPVPTVVTGQIPPSKDDLQRFYVNTERVGSNHYLYLAWERSNLLGSAHLDFEFNQSSDVSSNGETPVRSAGDLLIDFDFSGSGNPVLVKHTWITSGNPTTDCEASNTLPCWNKAVNLGNFAEAQVNSVDVIDTNPPGNPRTLTGNTKNGINSTFGEAGINLTGSGIFQPNVCQTFGSAWLKSRSSGNSFTSELKDFIAPIHINLTNCGTVNIHKQDDLGAALQDAVFTLYVNNAPLAGPRGSEDTATTKTCTTNAAGNCTISNVVFGNYWAVETTGVPGHDLAADQSFTLNQNTPNLTISLTFVDPRQPGAIQVTKTAKHKDSGTSPNLAATFTVKQGGVSVGTITTNGTTGIGCLANLPQGTYTVEETTPPTGYAKDTSVETVNVDSAGTCSSGFKNVSFENIPLTDLTVSVDSKVVGGTASTIECKQGSTVVASGSTASNGDGSTTASNLVPGTYVCTVVIDP